MLGTQCSPMEKAYLICGSIHTMHLYKPDSDSPL